MKEQLRKMLITAKVLQFCADIFAVFGLFLFAYIYFNHYRESGVMVLRDPAFIVTILIPFLPAAVLAWAAARKRAEIRAIVEQIRKQP